MKSRVSRVFYIFIAFFPVFFISLGFVGGRILTNSNIKQIVLTSDILGISSPEKISSTPIRLKIPAINVNASIQSVWLDRDGEMEVPGSPVDVGWLDLGRLSGSIGSAVISGHLNQENGEPGVFANLNKLKVGENIFLEKVNGDSAVFVVSEIRTYDQGYAEDVFGFSDGERLSLVTCKGVWDKNTKSYSKRLVVIALLVP